MENSTDHLWYAIHHVFLPPQLPQTGDDDDSVAKDVSLLKFLSQQLRFFASIICDSDQRAFWEAHYMINTLVSILGESGQLHQPSLEAALSGLCQHGGVIPIPFPAQNVALIVRKEGMDLVFEAFELCPPNNATMAAKGRLVRCFPKVAVAVDLKTFQSPGFLATLVATITKVGNEPDDEFLAKVIKAGQVVIEERDTTDPRLVTDFLMRIIEATGRVVDATRVWKNTRDDVLYSTGLVPWRRSYLWLLVRVTLQLQLKRTADSDDCYKEFIVFFLSRVLDIARDKNLPNDILHCMICKISRRLLKMRPLPIDSEWYKLVNDTSAKTIEFMEVRWDTICQSSDPDINLLFLKKLKPDEDTKTELKDLDEFLKLLKSLPESRSANSFLCSEILVRYPPEVLPTIKRLDRKGDSLFILAAVETWVTLNLSSWLSHHLGDDDSCADLANVIQNYHSLALSHYDGNPEGISTMVLTILELWVGCDKVATRKHPMLLEYDTCMPIDELQSLILPFKDGMERLSRIEEYMIKRSSMENRSYSPIYTDLDSASSFAVRYFRGSPEHQKLRAKIVKSAQEERRRKKQELVEVKRQHEELMNKYYEATCEMEWVYPYYGSRYQEHSEACPRCEYLHQAQSMTIAIHEWPLPKEDKQASAVVFELQCPPVFGAWRDLTLFVVLGVLQSSYVSCEKVEFIASPDYFLSKFRKWRAPVRVGLLSTTKPHTDTHRDPIRVELADEENVCRDNGLTPRYYDRVTCCFTDSIISTEKLANSCTYNLQNAPSLQEFLSRPASCPDGPAPNKVIATQHACPDHMKLDEFRALANMPLGTRCQWSNILVQLAAPSIDLKKVDTGLVLLQVAWQAGPRVPVGIVLREGHQSLKQEEFGKKLVEGLRHGLVRIRENWESVHALGSFVILAERLLSLTGSTEIQNHCLSYLDDCRKTAARWTDVVRQKYRDTEDADQGAELLCRIFEISQICAFTFNVDQHHLEGVLKEPAIAKMLIKSSIDIQQTTRSAFDSQNDLHRIFSHRWKQLCFRASPLLFHEIVHCESSCLDDAISQVWESYCPSTGSWEPPQGTEGPWLVTAANDLRSGATQTVHFNLLTAELLIDGLPLSRLPSEYEEDPVYSVLFGRATLEVIPTTMPGMRFSAMRRHNGYDLYFGFSSVNFRQCVEKTILISCKRDHEIISLIPKCLFQGLLPQHFVDDYVHWYHLDTNFLEFRPIAKPWNPVSNHWKLSRSGEGWELHKSDDNISLIHMSSPTGSRTWRRFFSLVEENIYLHMTWHSAEKFVQIELPRISLTFIIRPDSPTLILSREYPGMYLGRNRKLGTFIGLKSKLVLKNNKGEQLVLVPDGDITWSRNELDHVDVRIRKGTAKRVLNFNVDGSLGRIVDNGDLHSMLTRCYLHALTASCMPDSLTRKTGTEEALEILRSAAVRSFSELKPGESKRLQQISRLAPSRSFHPPQIRVMQRIKWDERLSFMSQHADLHNEAKAIQQEATSLEFFHQNKPEVQIKFDFGSEYLHERDQTRSSTFRRFNFGAEHFQTSNDRHFLSRTSDATDKNIARSNAAFHAAAGIFGELRSTQYVVKAGLASHIWGLFNLGGTMEIPGEPLEECMIGFNTQYLQNWQRTLARHWLQIHQTLQAQESDKSSRVRYMVFVATLAYAAKADMQVIQLLMALSSVSELRNLAIPSVQRLNLKKGREINVEKLEVELKDFLVCFTGPSDYSLECHPGEEKGEARKRLRNEFKANQSRLLTQFIKSLVSQWPCEVPVKPVDQMFERYLDTDQAMPVICRLFKSCWDNLHFFQYLEQMENIIQNLSHAPLDSPALQIVIPKKRNTRPILCYISEVDLFLGQPPPSQPNMPVLQLESTKSVGQNLTPEARASTKRLNTLVDLLQAQATRQHEKDYAEALQKSVSSLIARRFNAETRPKGSDLQDRLLKYHILAEMYLDDARETLDVAAHKIIISWGSSSCLTGAKVFLYTAPQTSPLFFLRQLSRRRWSKLSQDWRKAIVEYGVAITVFQRSRRLLNALDNPQDLGKELENTGHNNWQPIEYPDSLLIELESDIMIRDVQEEIAFQMRTPPNNDNSVVQLHMGEGKSSVIVPAVAAALANGDRLVRVIVAKPQSRQMNQILVAKLGGLCDRKTYHMPFSRSLKLNSKQAQIIDETYKRCLKDGGVLLVQPEHILSFKLMSIETMLSQRSDISNQLLQTQHFSDNYSRDIVDESDENFSVKFELVYTMGTQQSVDLAPERWTIIQQILTMIKRLVPKLQRRFPLAIEVEQNAPSGSFARLRVLDDGAAQYLKRRIARKICHSSFPGFPISRQSDSLRELIFKYLTQRELDDAEIAEVESERNFLTDTTRGIALLLRGLLAGDVLAFSLAHKRWRVNYGIDASRKPPTRLAVPFRAKDSPTPRSEFSHLEVVIILTCLSYYYGGLSNVDLFLAFEHLFRSDQADSEYALWIYECSSLPTAFRTLVGVNLKDRPQCIQYVFPHLRRTKNVIDYFLAKIVFAREIREFPDKLSVSGWDIGQRKPEPTTGFSGTNDSQHLLPLDVKYHDLDKQTHTNALVLRHLLQNENTVKLVPARDAKENVTDADHLLGLMTIAGSGSETSNVEVIIDVGSQILELTNLQVAERWLEMRNTLPLIDQKQAAVFFNDKEELSVVDRKGRVEPLQISPFNRQLGSCLVFLDEAHTRGTDLRLPREYRAAVTLGAKLTKDRLVQACMRMRKLGNGQSVVFYVSEEIQNKIFAATGKPRHSSITVADVLLWSMHETHMYLRSSIPLWAAQGTRFQKQACIWSEVKRENTYQLSETAAERFLEKEAVSLDIRYSPKRHKDNDTSKVSSNLGSGDLDTHSQSAILDRCSRFGCDKPDSIGTSLDEEQERELSPETEQEREVERPPPAKPHKHQIHPDVLDFICSGTVSSNSPAFFPAFHVLKNTTVTTMFDLDKFPSALLVTRDFARTVKTPQLRGKATTLDAFQRPVQWILTSIASKAKKIKNMVIISPYEAQKLMPMIQSALPSSKVSLHLYAPRTNLAFWPLDHLDLYTVPMANQQMDKQFLSHPFKLQLNLFAGQLYINCFKDYAEACDYLCLHWRRSPISSSKDAHTVLIRADGFIVPTKQEEVKVSKLSCEMEPLTVVNTQSRVFVDSPTKFLRVHLTRIRHDCEPIDKTHWGRILVGEQLEESDF